jgi:hypothetical protein
MLYRVGKVRADRGNLPANLALRPAARDATVQQSRPQHAIWSLRAYSLAGAKRSRYQTTPSSWVGLHTNLPPQQIGNALTATANARISAQVEQGRPHYAARLNSSAEISFEEKRMETQETSKHHPPSIPHLPSFRLTILPANHKQTGRASD